MRDMLRSLSEVDHRGKIALPLSAISLAMTRVRECTDFISTYIQHGFWGEFFPFIRIQYSPSHLSQVDSYTGH